jgi:hypothetical protein
MITHIFKNEIYITVVICPKHIQQANDIFMVLIVHFLQEHNFSKGSLSVSGILHKRL